MTAILMLGILLFSGLLSINGFLASSRYPTSFVTLKQIELPRIHNQNQPVVTKNSKTSLSLFLGPQIGFIGSIVAAIVTYIYFNIDQIKEKQRIAIDAAMTEQSVQVQSAKDSQRLAIEKAKKEQEMNLLKAKQNAEDARRRAEEVANKLKPK